MAKVKTEPKRKRHKAPQTVAAQAPSNASFAMPSREDILAFIEREKAEAQNKGQINFKIGKREIARAFGIKGQDRIALKKVLKQFENEGSLERKGTILKNSKELPSSLVADIKGRDRDGELIATPLEWDEEAFGPTPLIMMTVPRKTHARQPVPGVGQRVLVRINKIMQHDDGTQYTYGRTIKILDKARSTLLGIFRSFPAGGGRLQPIDKKNMNRDLVIAAGQENGAMDGDLVSAHVLRESHSGLASAKVIERLGSMASEKAVSLIAIHSHRIPHVFASDVIAEADTARPATLEGRDDWRALPLITIDPPDARDHDDAVHATEDDNPANKDGHVLTIAIADVAAYVRPHSALDREAFERGNSVYFPDRVVPMLPERISNDLCSLRPLEDRPALAVRIIINAQGHKIAHSFHRIMMRSAAKLSYQQAQAAIDGHADEITTPLLDKVLRPLWRAYEALKHERAQRSPLDLDLPERKLQLKPDGTIDRVIIPTRLDAHKLIEEFMILANVAAAETLEEKKQPLIYRAHDEPSLEKLMNLSDFLASLDIKLAKGQALRPMHFNAILARVRESEHEHVVNEVVLRSQAQAEYVAHNYGHFGLNLRRYAHFTSPIRRYADLIVHRALIRALGFGADGLDDLTPAKLTEIAEHISAAERRAMTAERETIDRMIATWLCERIGASFMGRIAGVTRAGLFVKLTETGADGFIPLSTLRHDYFHHDEAHHAIVGTRSGETYRLGDRVEVKLVEAAPLAGALRFELLSDGKEIKKSFLSPKKRTPQYRKIGRTSKSQKSTKAKSRRK